LRADKAGRKIFVPSRDTLGLAYSPHDKSSRLWAQTQNRQHHLSHTIHLERSADLNDETYGP